MFALYIDVIGSSSRIRKSSLNVMHKEIECMQ